MLIIFEKYVVGYENIYYWLLFSGFNYDFFLLMIGFEFLVCLLVVIKWDIGFDCIYLGYVLYISGLVKLFYELFIKIICEDYVLVDYVIGCGDCVGIDKL